MCELLAPAGDEASFYAAVHSGADAVYLGLTDFSARRSAANFSLENLKEHIDYAHALGVRVHVALNTLIKEDELARFFENVAAAWNAGADALIIQDIFLGKRIKELYPEIVLHLSTQAGVCNLYGARMAKRCGFSRVILARETPMECIVSIAKEIETEVFVQGALCTCFSGQCYLSAFIGGNSGNRGLCKQPCRKKYKADRAGFETLSYKLSLSDLCMGEDVKKLAEAGVASFKIEGRMRSAAYVGAAVNYYRNILDGRERGREAFSDLKRAYNRGDYTKGYAFGQDKALLSSDIQGHKGEKVGVIAKCGAGKFAFVRSSYAPSDGDGFKIIRGDAGAQTEIGGGGYSSAFPKAAGGFYLPANAKYREGDGVFLTLDVSLSARVSARRRAVPISVSVSISEGKPPRAEVKGRFGVREYTAGFACERAKTKALSRDEIANCFQKTDGYPFEVSFKEICIEGAPFAVKSALNAFRRDVYADVFRTLAGERKPLAVLSFEKNTGALPVPPFQNAVIGDDFSFAEKSARKIGAAVLAPKNYRDSEYIQKFLNISEYYAWHKWLYLPAFMTDADIAAASDCLSLFDGVYAEGAWAAELCRERGLKLFAGTGFNLFNSVSLSVLAEEQSLTAAAVSKELSSTESSALQNVFRLAGGAVKVMELGHCLFGRQCGSCDRRAAYTLTDEQGRAFPLRRYESSVCRFELFNCARLAPRAEAYPLFDLRTLSDEEKCAALAGERTGKITAGLADSGVL